MKMKSNSLSDVKQNLKLNVETSASICFFFLNLKGDNLKKQYLGFFTRVILKQFYSLRRM